MRLEKLVIFSLDYFLMEVFKNEVIFTIKGFETRTIGFLIVIIRTHLTHFELYFWLELNLLFKMRLQEIQVCSHQFPVSTYLAVFFDFFIELERHQLPLRVLDVRLYLCILFLQHKGLPNFVELFADQKTIGLNYFRQSDLNDSSQEIIQKDFKGHGFEFHLDSQYEDLDNEMGNENGHHFPKNVTKGLKDDLKDVFQKSSKKFLVDIEDNVFDENAETLFNRILEHIF